MTACRSRWSKEREAAEGEPEVWASPTRAGSDRRGSRHSLRKQGDFGGGLRGGETTDCCCKCR